MASPEFLVVDVGAENIKLGATVTILAVASTLEEARKKAEDEVQPRSPFIAIVERKEFFRRRPKIELQSLDATLIKPEPPAKEPVKP